jgi:hypothetical protein
MLFRFDRLVARVVRISGMLYAQKTDRGDRRTPDKIDIVTSQ